jgi:phospholipase C
MIATFSILLILTLSTGTSLTYATANNTKTPIKHLINIYLENHTFDNFFGTYPIDPSSPRQNVIANLSTPVNLLQNSSLMNELSPVASDAFSTPNPIEGNTAYHIDWNRGRMNNFIEGSGAYSMTYYTAAQLGPIWDLAEEYSLGDMYFSPVLSESFPNTMYYLAGYTPVMNNYGPPFIPFSQTIFGELESYNISWGLSIPYQNQSATYSEWSSISGMNDYASHVLSWSTFVSDLGSGNIPAVSWVFSQKANGTDQGAPSNVLKGEAWLMYMINKIEESPIWNSTAVTITWDDPGGYYDQIAPPVLDGVQLGFRLPLIIVSPFAKENYVSNTVLTHSSILAFIDYNWELPALNQYVSSVNIPLDFFDFNMPYVGSVISRASLVFGFGASFPLPQQPHFNLPGNLQKLNISDTFPTLPQYNLATLPYPEYGATNLTLSSVSSEIFVKENTVIIPLYASPYFLTLLVAANVALLIWGIRIRKRRREREGGVEWH